MKRFILKDLSQAETAALCRRPSVDFSRIEPAVREIIQKTRDDGDAAVRYFTEKFDGVKMDSFFVDVPELDDIPLDSALREAFQTAYDNIRNFHAAQMPAALKAETMPGVVCSRETRPIQSVGLYVPGGTAVLPSTVLMLGVPAQLAGCWEIVLATPPARNGAIADEILYTAALCGIGRIFVAGGAQAIAAMAWGTESVPKVDKIFGPGNQYVTCAKMLLQQSDALVAIDMPAGPSEVLVIADETADPGFVAADLLSQAEHGADSQVVLVSTSQRLCDETGMEINNQLESLPRNDIARKCLDNSLMLIAENLDEAIRFSNLWAPEHLIIASDHAEALAPKIEHAGSVFLGHWTPESAGDYASGTNHTLPTSGYARMYSGVTLDSFFKYITFQQISGDGLRALGPTVERMATAEELDAHRMAVSLRLKKLDSIS